LGDKKNDIRMRLLPLDLIPAGSGIDQVVHPDERPVLGEFVAAAAGRKTYPRAPALDEVKHTSYTAQCTYAKQIPLAINCALPLHEIIEVWAAPTE
jgi:hypothetical protein